MDKFITYKEDDLKRILGYMRYKLSQIKTKATWMQEQHEGKRDNITMEEGIHILSDVKQLEISIEDFKLLLPEE